MLGGTDVEACIYADISPSALYEYQKKNPEFLERKQALKNMPSLRAKKTVVDHLDKDVAIAQWWLVRRHPDEFGGVTSPKAPTIDDMPKMDLYGEAKKRAAKYCDPL